MIVWITGGGTGIGKSLAKRCLAQGHRVVISGRRAEVLRQAAQEFTQDLASGFPLDSFLLTLPADVSRPDQVQGVVQEIAGRWGDVDILVNNAGVLHRKSFADETLDSFEETFRINVYSQFLCTKAVLDKMKKRNAGAIVNISSIVGQWASPHSPAYSSSKFAVTGLTDSLRQELRGTRIHVMAVFPGFIATPMTAPFTRPSTRRFGASPDGMAKAILQGLARRRREVYYPFYVPWLLRLHRWFPGPMEALRRRVDP